ncbi:MAG: hypothetical protein IJD04_00185 [Desulfovibrionaceae bacterium]|nr:hypothetical protein [Desulfovibrionaceae bacterium]
MDLSKKLICLLFLTISGAALAACGKSGPPQPPGGVQQFSWTWTRAELINECLAIQGGMQGNMDNFYEVVLELQPADSEDFCIGCPFLPAERQSFSRRAAGFKIEQLSEGAAGPVQDAAIALTYCPERKAPAYQWRLLGVNVNQIAPHALTPVQYLASPLSLE